MNSYESRMFHDSLILENEILIFLPAKAVP